MITLVVLLITSVLLLWVLTLYAVWRKESQPSEGPIAKLAPLYNKSSRFMRRIWFKVLRIVRGLQSLITLLATKAFFAIFPSAKKAFEVKDELTGLEHGPSSYFLKSISPEKGENIGEIKKNRRKRKNV